MKNKKAAKWLGLLAITAFVAIIAISMTACKDDDSTPLGFDGGGGTGGGGTSGGSGTGGGSGGGTPTNGSLTIKGFPNRANGLYVTGSGGVMVGSLPGPVESYLYVLDYNNQSAPLKRIVNGSVTLPLWKYTVPLTFIGYNGNDQNVDIYFLLVDSPDLNNTNGKAIVNGVTANFSGGKATVTIKEDNIIWYEDWN